MANESDSEPMDVDESLNNTQETQFGTPGPSGGSGPSRNLTDVYAQQYDEIQRIWRKFRLRIERMVEGLFPVELRCFYEEGLTTDDAVNRVGKLLQHSTVLCKQERKVLESVFGSSVLSMCAQVTKSQAMSLDTNLSAFDIQAFADGITGCITDPISGRWDWEKLSHRTFIMFKRSPAFSYLYGSFKPTELPPKEPKERQQRRQANRAAAEKKEPEKVTNVQATDEGNDKAVQHLKKVLKRQFRSNGDKPIGFFDCVLDPQSFHRTIENIFHLSFLMKNNFCAVRQENGGLPFIHPISSAEVSALQKGKKLQCIVSITPEEWKTLLQVFEIREAMVTNNAA